MNGPKQSCPELLTLDEVATLLRLSTKAVQSRVKRNTIPGVIRTPTGRCFSPLRFDAAKLRAWLAPKPATAVSTPEYTVTIGDRPAEDIAAVVRGEPVSNRLILYVRRMAAADRAADAKVDHVSPTSRETTAREVFEACVLAVHEESFARVIAEAAGWDHLAGKVVP